MKVNKKCECIFCSTCKGSGDVWVSGGHMSAYRFDDMGDSEPCPECDGDGLSLVCLKCQLEYEDEQGVQVDAKGGSNSEGCPHCDDPDCHWLFHG